MKRALLVLVALALLPGCAYILPAANEAPKGYINSISPSEVTAGETVRLSGYGTDSDGQVVGYRWRSDRDGELGTTAELETHSLSVGRHAIFFMVQDNNDAWSAEASGSVTVVAAVAAPVTIDAFTASPLAIERGDSVTLTWQVSNARTTTLDHGVGTVSATGSITVTPDETTTYTLTATGDGSTASAAITVSVQTTVHRITLAADTEVSGFVRSSGAFTTGYVYVGDDSHNRGIQGFLTYNISRIPDDAVITKVIVDMSDYETPHDRPFPDLESLTAYEHPYDTLYNEYWSLAPSAPLAEWWSLKDLDTPVSEPGFVDALQRRVGERDLQIRLQFAEKETDDDDENDLLRWVPEHLPMLIVEYHIA